MGGCVDINHSRRSNNLECYYWIREEGEPFPSNEWILKNKADGFFYAKYGAPKNNQASQINGVFMTDNDTVTIETEDDVSKIRRGCVILLRGKKWLVTGVQSLVHEEETEFSNEEECKYYISMRS